MKKTQLDKFWIGLLVCLLLPVLVFVCTWTPLSGVSLAEVPNWVHYPFFMQYLLLCLSPNLVVLFFGYKTDSFKLCRGGVLGLAPYLCWIVYYYV